jgi:serine/threonine protein kinase
MMPLRGKRAAAEPQAVMATPTLWTSKMRKTLPALETTFETYESVGPLADGGAGHVVKVKDSQGHVLAVKLLNPDRSNALRRKRFKNEVLFCSREVHPNVVRVIDHGVTTLRGVLVPFYVMPLYDGSLRDLLNESPGPDVVLKMFSQLIDGVEAAHLCGVTHRDLKPENVLIRRSDMSLAVADFGIAHFVDEELYTAVETKASERLANFKYAAPEQKERGHPTGAFTDVYALGLMLNELFTRRVPAGAGYTTIADVVPEYAYLDAIVAHMIQQNSANRLQSIDGVKKALIARRKEFVTRQELDAARGRVVPVGASSDPLLDDPPSLVDFDWREGVLTLVLSRPVTNEWVRAFQNIGSRTSVMGADITDFRIAGNKAVVGIRDTDVQ